MIDWIESSTDSSPCADGKGRDPGEVSILNEGRSGRDESGSIV